MGKLEKLYEGKAKKIYATEHVCLGRKEVWIRLFYIMGLLIN